VRYGDGGNDPVGTDAEGYRDDSGHVDHGNVGGLLYSLHERCTATRAGSSGGGQDNGVYTGTLQLVPDLYAELLGVGHGGAVTDGGIEEIMKGTDTSLFLQIPEDIHRKDPVGVLVGVGLIVTTVSGLILALLEVHNPGDIVLAVVLGAGGGDVVRVAERHDTAGCHKSDLGVSHILDGGAGIHPVEHRKLVLSLEGLALELLDQHVDGTLGTDLFVEHVDTDALLDVTLFLGGPDGLSFHLLEQKSGHGGHCFAHAASAVGSLDHVGALLVHLGTGVFGIESGNGGNAQLLSDGATYGAAGGAVTSGVESRTGDEPIGLELLDGLGHELGGRVDVVGEVVVTADYGSDYLGLALESSFKSHTGTDYAFADLRFDVCLFLPADAGEELVDVMNHTIGHLFPSLLTGLQGVLGVLLPHTFNGLGESFWLENHLHHTDLVLPLLRVCLFADFLVEYIVNGKS